MNCMKCGREIEETQVFCPECLAEMEKHPVKPGTVVQLPYMHTYQAAKKNAQRRKATLSLEEQVKLLRRWVWVLVLALVLAAALLAGVGYMIFQQRGEIENKVLPGQNYSSVVNPTISTSNITQR